MSHSTSPTQVTLKVERIPFVSTKSSSRIWKREACRIALAIFGSCILGALLGVILQEYLKPSQNNETITTIDTTSVASTLNAQVFNSTTSTSITPTTISTGTATTVSTITSTTSTSTTSTSTTTTSTTTSSTSSTSTSTTTSTTTTTSSTTTTTSSTASSSTSTSTTTTTTTVTTTTTTQTTTTTGGSLACGSNETVYGVWNTTAGGDSIFSSVGTSVGTYYMGQIPSDACDDNFSTEYTSYGNCTSSSLTVSCGLNTGFYRTPLRGASLIIGLQVCTAGGLPTRDPITITFEGSNEPASALQFGSSWTLLYSGPSGLAINPGRVACGIPQLFPTNTVWYSSYRFLVTSKRGGDSSTWYSEVLLIGY